MDKYTDLSERQRELCTLFLKHKGSKNWKKKAAKQMGIKLNTLKTHKSEVYTKLCVETQAELMYWILTEGLLLREEQTK